jgi:signal transduction histidine kinase
LADPDASTDTLRDTLEELLSAGQDQERLVEAMLALATSEGGLDRRDPVELSTLARDAIQQRHDHTRGSCPYVHADLAQAWTAGNRDLLKRLVANLLDNAYRYNRAEGRVDVRTSASNGQTVLTVANTGPVVPGAEITRLLQPFQRFSGERTSHPDGHGLGLSIVAAIATAHDATLTVEPGQRGGLDIEVAFPQLPESSACRVADPVPASSRTAPGPLRPTPPAGQGHEDHLPCAAQAAARQTAAQRPIATTDRAARGDRAAPTTDASEP